MKLIVREATRKDIPSILNLLYELERPKPSDASGVKLFNNKISEYFSDSQKTIIVSEQEKEVTGFVSVIYLKRLNQVKLEMHIPELIVTKSSRKSGTGKKLMQYCINLAKQKNCHRIRLESGNLRKDAHEFYKNIGFEQSALSFTKHIV
ncbi:MAG: GNAT family N-acetyltransferase [Nitrosopumilus sp.]|nr:MAG: GNAT family N-acetyltransferase [Nitrosopumilus sp.]